MSTPAPSPLLGLAFSVLLALGGCSFPDIPIIGRACDNSEHVCSDLYLCVQGTCQPGPRTECRTEGDTVPCSYSGLGVCASVPGSRACDGARYSDTCEPPAAGQGQYQTLENLCDGLDNDCDATVDQRPLLKGTSTTTASVRAVPWDTGYRGTYASFSPGSEALTLHAFSADPYLSVLAEDAAEGAPVYAELNDFKVTRVGNAVYTLVQGRHLTIGPQTLEIRVLVPGGVGSAVITVTSESLLGPGVIATVDGGALVLYPSPTNDGVTGVRVDAQGNLGAPKVLVTGQFPAALALSPTADGKHAVFGYVDSLGIHLQRIDGALNFDGTAVTQTVPAGLTVRELVLAPGAEPTEVTAAWSLVDPGNLTPPSLRVNRAPFSSGTSLTVSPDPANAAIAPQGLWLTAAADGDALLGWAGSDLARFFIARIPSSGAAVKVSGFSEHSAGNRLFGVNASEVFDVPGSQGGVYRLGAGRNAFVCAPGSVVK